VERRFFRVFFSESLLFISAFAVLASFILLVSVCVCGSPDKKKTMGIVSRYWAFQIGKLETLTFAVDKLIGISLSIRMPKNIKN
jgi:hypothetical protein